MENEKQSAKNPKRDQRAATQTPGVDIPLTIFVHDGSTLTAREQSANRSPRVRGSASSPLRGGG